MVLVGLFKFGLALFGFLCMLRGSSDITIVAIVATSTKPSGEGQAFGVKAYR